MAPYSETLVLMILMQSSLLLLSAVLCHPLSLTLPTPFSVTILTNYFLILPSRQAVLTYLLPPIYVTSTYYHLLLCSAAADAAKYFGVIKYQQQQQRGGTALY